MYVPSTGKLVAAIVLTVWGLGIVLRGLMGSPGGGSSPYEAGRLFAWIFGFGMLAIGGRQLWFEIRARR
jgi:hypothetical protein